MKVGVGEGVGVGLGLATDWNALRVCDLEDSSLCVIGNEDFTIAIRVISSSSFSVATSPLEVKTTKRPFAVISLPNVAKDEVGDEVS